MIDLKPYDELDSAYQFSSALVFFRRHYDDSTAIWEVLQFEPDKPSKLRSRLANLQRVVGIGLEVWEPPPGKAH